MFGTKDLTTILAGVALASAAILIGCGKSSDVSVSESTQGDSKTIVVKGEKGAEVKMEQKEDGSSSISIKNEDGTTQVMSSEAAAIPKEFPEDVPTYPGMTVQLSQSVSENQTFTILASTKDAIDKVAAEFKAKLVEKGWTEKFSMNQPGSGDEKATALLNYGKEGRIVNIVLNTEDEGTGISILTGKE
jgi:hypothetical protein